MSAAACRACPDFRVVRQFVGKGFPRKSKGDAGSNHGAGVSHLKITSRLGTGANLNDCATRVQRSQSPESPLQTETLSDSRPPATGDFVGAHPAPETPRRVPPPGRARHAAHSPPARVIERPWPWVRRKPPEQLRTGRDPTEPDQAGVKRSWH